ncbi:MAG: carbohydrate porin [Planctomycetia bacterium]|nr:carbohydrate porin [Planctomycetia bacterium]
MEEPAYEMAPHLLGSKDGLCERLDDAGRGDYCVIADGGKLGVHEGLYLELRAEHRYGETIVGNVGCFISPTLIADLPVYNSEEVYLTNVLLTQELTGAFSVFAGKMDMLDGGMNAFAHGRGKTQLSNTGFVFNPIVSATVPYSTLGTGFVFHPEAPFPTPTRPRRRSAARGACIGTSISFSWSIRPTRGWGPFGRAGIADANTSPIDAFLSFGVGGNVPGRVRRDDTFGIGWYWVSASPQIGTLITSQFGPIGAGQGIE